MIKDIFIIIKWLLFLAVLLYIIFKYAFLGLEPTNFEMLTLILFSISENQK
jgi:hypothetical protein